MEERAGFVYNLDPENQHRYLTYLAMASCEDVGGTRAAR